MASAPKLKPYNNRTSAKPNVMKTGEPSAGTIVRDRLTRRVGVVESVKVGGWRVVRFVGGEETLRRSGNLAYLERGATPSAELVALSARLGGGALSQQNSRKRERRVDYDNPDLYVDAESADENNDVVTWQRPPPKKRAAVRRHAVLARESIVSSDSSSDDDDDDDSLSGAHHHFERGPVVSQKTNAFHPLLPPATTPAYEQQQQHRAPAEATTRPYDDEHVASPYGGHAGPPEWLVPIRPRPRGPVGYPAGRDYHAGRSPFGAPPPQRETAVLDGGGHYPKTAAPRGDDDDDDYVLRLRFEDDGSFGEEPWPATYARRPPVVGTRVMTSARRVAIVVGLARRADRDAALLLVQFHDQAPLVSSESTNSDDQGSSEHSVVVARERPGVNPPSGGPRAVGVY